MSNVSEDIYNPKFVKNLFDRMSHSYGRVNYITSFGFSERWRRQCVEDLPHFDPYGEGFDMMSGMGENWAYITQRLNSEGKLVGVDISEQMNSMAELKRKKLDQWQIQINPVNILENPIPSESADFIISTFGIKTFDERQKQQFANEVERILKPGGVFSFIEISKPHNQVLANAYMFYLKYIIPTLGRVFLGYADDYRMLGKYCEAFRDCRNFMTQLESKGLSVQYKEYFYGCASGVFGVKSKTN